MDEVGDRLLATMRRLAPVKVRAYDAEENARDIAVPTRRKRWSQVVTTIESRPWVRVELCDKSGAVLGYVDNDGPAEEIEDIGTGGNGQVANARWFLEAMIKAQTAALSFRDKEHQALLQGMVNLMQVSAEQTRELVVFMRLQRDAAIETAAARAAAAARSDEFDLEQVAEIIKASPKLLQGLAPLFFGLKAAVSPKPPASSPANGAKP